MSADVQEMLEVLEAGDGSVFHTGTKINEVYIVNYEV